MSCMHVHHTSGVAALPGFPNTFMEMASTKALLHNSSLLQCSTVLHPGHHPGPLECTDGRATLVDEVFPFVWALPLLEVLLWRGNFFAWCLFPFLSVRVQPSSYTCTPVLFSLSPHLCIFMSLLLNSLIH